MFWTDWGSDPRVEGANLQGEERFVVETAPDGSGGAGVDHGAQTGQIAVARA